MLKLILITFMLLSGFSAIFSQNIAEVVTLAKKSEKEILAILKKYKIKTNEGSQFNPSEKSVFYTSTLESFSNQYILRLNFDCTPVSEGTLMSALKDIESYVLSNNLAIEPERNKRVSNPNIDMGVYIFARPEDWGSISFSISLTPLSERILLEYKEKQEQAQIHLNLENQEYKEGLKQKYIKELKKEHDEKMEIARVALDKKIKQILGENNEVNESENLGISHDTNNKALIDTSLNN